MKKGKDIVKFIMEQIEFEKEIVDSLNNSLTDLKNPAVKGTLRGITLDSLKHAQMYESALVLLTKVPQALNQDQLDKQRSLVEKHIKLEAKLIKRISEEIPEVKDEKVKLLLNAILADERRHHSLLKQVLEIIVRQETITEEEWFDVIWKSTPFHGAPGG